MNDQYEKDLAAVKQNGYALQYIKDQTEEMCLAAVKEDGYALKFVKEQTEEMCLAAVKQNGYALCYIKNEEMRKKINDLIRRVYE